MLPDYAARCFSTRLFRKKRIATPKNKLLNDVNRVKASEHMFEARSWRLFQKNPSIDVE